MTDRLDLPERHRRTLEDLIRAHLPDVEVWAYGSRVNGKCHAGSDLDLVLRGPGLEKIPAERLASFADAVCESNIPFLVQMHDWARMSERFQLQIKEHHAPLRRPNRRMSEFSKWSARNWGEIATLEYGKGLRAGGMRHGSVPVFGTNGQIGWHDQPLCPRPGVVVGRKGAYRGIRYSPTPFHVIDTAFYLRPRINLDARWAYYELLTEDINGMDSGSAIPSTSREQFYRLPVSVPPLAEQRAIAHILGTLDDKIELNRRMNETLEAMARALFKAWFMDFEPVRARAHGADVSLPDHVCRLFPDSYDDSALGKVPSGWKVVELTDLIEVNPKRPSLRKGESAPYVPMSSMPTSGHTPSQVSVRPFSSGMRFVNGDTLLARITPCLENGKTAYVDFLKQGQVGWGSTEYIVLRPEPCLPFEFAYCLARSLEFRDFAIQSMTGTSGRQRVQPTAVGQFLLPHPPEQIARMFGKLVRPLIERVRMGADESQNLTDLRDALLPKVISGELRVPDAERIAADVI